MKKSRWCTVRAMRLAPPMAGPASCPASRALVCPSSIWRIPQWAWRAMARAAAIRRSCPASWDGQVAYAYGALIGREARAEGYNISIAGGIDLARDPRDGRNFEYLGEDPVLAGESFAKWVRGLQDQTVIGDIKHYAFNDQETGRTIANVVLDERSMRESDLLAFEIGIKKGQPGMVMCAYNKVNGDWSCENDYLLN